MSKSTNVIFYIFFFAKVQPVRTIVTDRYTDTETDNPPTIGEILQICLKTKAQMTLLSNNMIKTFYIQSFTDQKRKRHTIPTVKAS